LLDDAESGTGIADAEPAALHVILNGLLGTPLVHRLHRSPIPISPGGIETMFATGS
jgi:hypothetical protein